MKRQQQTEQIEEILPQRRFRDDDDLLKNSEQRVVDPELRTKKTKTSEFEGHPAGYFRSVQTRTQPRI